MEASNLVILAADGLRASALGAYGNTWFPTPSLDRLASESVVFDQALVTEPDLAATYRSLWNDASGGVSLLHQLGDAYDTLLVTDDDKVRQWGGGESFDRVALVPQPEERGVATHAAETAVGETLALLLDQLEEASRHSAVFAWAHLRFANGPWDAPLDLAASLLDGDDPQPTADLASPSGDTRDDEEFSFTATVRYAAQVMALDHCLGVLPAALDELLGKGGYVLALAGLRGFALGEHGRVGIDDARPYNEMRHVPLMLRRPDAPRHHRFTRLVTLADLPGMLLAASPHSLADFGVDSVRLESPNGAALQDEHWKLLRPSAGEPQLYSKPDDRWEMNDVAARHHHVVEEFEARLDS